MRERPILFSAPMVRAIMDGHKTQTRRIVKMTQGFEPDDKCRHGSNLGYKTSPHRHRDKFGLFVYNEWEPGCFERDIVPCPYGEPGDRLWVRETHARYKGTRLSPVIYLADQKIPTLDERHDAGLLRIYPSIHMPRWASRINLEIVDVRVERLQEISEADALAEGILQLNDGGYASDRDGRHYNYASAVRSFNNLWDTINGEDSWDKNPYVWVVTFKRIERV